MSALQPLSGGKRTHCAHVATAVFDPFRTCSEPASFDHLAGHVKLFITCQRRGASQKNGCSMSVPGQRRRSQHVRNESAYPPIAAGEQTSRLVGSVPTAVIGSRTPATAACFEGGIADLRPLGAPGHIFARVDNYTSRDCARIPSTETMAAGTCSLARGAFWRTFCALLGREMLGKTAPRP